MKVLVSNDDGIFAPGVYTLVSVLREFAEVMVVCPDGQRSGFGHSISVSKPIRPQKVSLMEDVTAYQVNGSPVDCIKVALEKLCSESPDMVISGMNAGANVGQDVYYSGTIGAAREGAMYGLPAMAFSLSRDQHGALNFDQSNVLLKYVFDKLLNFSIPRHYFLNINLPAVAYESLKGVKVVNPEVTNKKFDYMDLKDPKGRPAYWLSNRYLRMDYFDGESDYQSVLDGFITISVVDIRIGDQALNTDIYHLFT